MEPFVIVVFVVVMLAAMAVFLHNGYSKQRRQKAFFYLICKTSLIYFYEIPVSVCLQTGVVQKLYNQGTGDFARSMGMLVLSALEYAERPAELYCARQEEEILGLGYYEAVVRFYYDHRWWQFDLREELSVESLQLVDQGNIPPWCEEKTSYWQLSQAERHKWHWRRELENSYLEPDIYGTDNAPYDRELEIALVQLRTEKIVNQWHFEKTLRATG